MFMKHVLVVLTALALVCGTALIAQAPAHHQMGKKVRDTVTFGEPVMIGSVTLKAGQYGIICDGATMSFTFVETGNKVLTVPCRGKELTNKAKTTELYIEPGPSGIGVVSKILLKGSNIEHVFQGD
jgi:hypothetical protein